MATLSDKVTSHIGAFSDTGSLTSWLQEAVIKVADMLSERRLGLYSADITDSGSGVTIANYRVLKAHKSGYRAIPIEAGLKAQAALSTSIHYATATSPVYYEENTKGYVLPGGGSITTFLYPTVTYATVAGSTQFLTDFENVIVLYAAIRGAYQNLSTEISVIKTHIDTDEDVELGMAKSNAEVQSTLALIKNLQEEYNSLIAKLG